MPRTRRRRNRAAGRRRRGARVLMAVLVIVVALLAIGSLVEIHAQSGAYRATTDAAYGAMASKLVVTSNQTGSRLASLMDSAPQLANHPPRSTATPLPSSINTARGVLEQGLDEAVSASADEASRAAALEPPPPTADTGSRFAAVMSDRASAAAALRSAIDQMLGMSPLPVAGAPQSSAPPAPTLLISPNQAAADMTAAGVLFQHADDEYRGLRADLRADRPTIRLPGSVWVPAPVADAPLGPARLGASAAQLNASAALVPFHQLVITAIGLAPAPVTSGGAQTTIPGCTNPQSDVAGGSVMVVPPTTSVQSTVTVTNCGTVVEPVVQVSETLALADAPGAAAPPPAAAGGTAQVRVSLRSGGSAALTMRALTVAAGHRYTLTFTIAIPASQAANNPAGSTQQLVLQIAG